ncbi:MAG: hypothetical protein A2V70_21140 [Planctomycetes bacterium RBG_13_63_9]|nr:MAG: hypothetical protein A2V70_21140 [Planctomycetes bacterium RBG_13_63_9]
MARHLSYILDVWLCANRTDFTRILGTDSALAAMNDSAITLDRLAAGSGQLYSLPAVAMEVLKMTRNPQLDTRTLKECIENDPALTGKILKVVNSSLFGLSCEVSDLTQALALLGTKPLKLLVLGFSLPARLFAGVEGETLGRYWEHTLTKAVAGREISETLFDVPGDEAFIAGLLQDLGMLLLIQKLGPPYVALLEKAATGNEDLLRLEVEAMGFDHTALSARLLAQWKLPDTLVEAVAWDSQHPPSNPAAVPEKTLPEKTLPRILHVAELVARLLADQRPGVLGKLLEVGQQYGNLSEAQLETMICSLVEKVQQLADVLSLQLPGQRDYRDVLVQAHEQMAAVATETAVDMIRYQYGEVPMGDDRSPPQDESLLEEIQALAEAVANAVGRTTDPPREPDAPAHTDPIQTIAPPHRMALTPLPNTGSVAGEWALGLLGPLAAAVAACRQSRCPMSLLLVQISQVDELILARGPEGYDHLRDRLQGLCEKIDHPRASSLPYGDSGFALILPDCERRLAVELATQLLSEIRHPDSRDTAGWPSSVEPHNGPEPRGSVEPRSGNSTVNLGVGIATVTLPPKNFPAENLLTGADRCLYASLASGGVVKSIETY